MKKTIALLAAVMLLSSAMLSACGGTQDDIPDGEATDTQSGNTDQTDPVPDGSEAPEEARNVFAEFFPVENNVPSGKQFQILARDLGEGIKGRISEVNYTWKSGKVSMEILAGVRDEYITLTPPEESPLELVYGESEFYNYVLYLPDGYDPADTETKWPVIYFFHGIGESGSDLEKILSYGMPKYLLQGGKVDAIMIAPQCPGDSHWADTNVEEGKLVQFVPEMTEKYNIDTDRMYLTGLSMGGRCTWKLALAMPDAFAAIAVCCGRTNTYEFDTIADMPIWMFHGAGDGTVSFDNINKIVPLLVENDHRYFKLTVYPSGSHEIWGTVYSQPELYDWLLAQSLSANAAAAK